MGKSEFLRKLEDLCYDYEQAHNSKPIGCIVLLDGEIVDLNTLCWKVYEWDGSYMEPHNRANNIELVHYDTHK